VDTRVDAFNAEPPQLCCEQREMLCTHALSPVRWFNVHIVQFGHECTD
jgi:hypothetical protein